MASTQKAFGIARRIFDDLRLRQRALAAVETLGTSGDPLLRFGAGTIGSASCVIRVVQLAAPTAKDVFNNASQVQVPHRIQIATEANHAGITDNVPDVLTRQQLIDILGVCLAQGSIVEWYEENNGTAATEATITGSKLKATFNADVYWPINGQ